MTKAEEHGVASQEANPANANPADRRRQFEAHIKRWHSSGLSQAEYCRRNELKWSTFQYWRRRLATRQAAVTLVQVPVGFNSEGLGPSGQGLALLLGNHYKVEIGDSFNPSTLARLVDTLERL